MLEKHKSYIKVLLQKFHTGTTGQICPCSPSLNTSAAALLIVDNLEPVHRDFGFMSLFSLCQTILRISIISAFSAFFLAFLFFPCNPSRRQGGRELLDDGHEMNNFFFARIQGISAQKGNSLHLDRMYSYHFDGLAFKY